ncbi:hypothetical protein [Kingella potus]|uniref:hypothetical protein n=1 Tax=Kingella potus TaxID=265175 RepID=UPI0011C048F4|nr:hypothetical protein [Kingella potus]UOO99880.1 hypothetical protein LVJ84_07290 [Kingella potus]
MCRPKRRTRFPPRSKSLLAANHNHTRRKPYIPHQHQRPSENAAYAFSDGLSKSRVCRPKRRTRSPPRSKSLLAVNHNRIRRKAIHPANTKGRLKTQRMLFRRPAPKVGCAAQSDARVSRHTANPAQQQATTASAAKPYIPQTPKAV